MINFSTTTFVLQTQSHKIEDEDVFTVKKIIDYQANKYSGYSYFTQDYVEVGSPFGGTPISMGKNVIPIGSLEFVQKWMKTYHGCDKMPPIEVPKCLRKDEFLQREYKFYDKENLPKKGYYFIKHVDKLKSFSYLGNLSLLDFDDIPNGHYLMSEYIPIIAEYRVFVSKNEIKAIQFYDGDCTIFPDVNTIKKMVNQYYFSLDCLFNYTLDIAVTSSNQTVVLEIHPIASVGLYGYADRNLLNMYSAGYIWYINHQDYKCYE